MIAEVISVGENKLFDSKINADAIHILRELSVLGVSVSAGSSVDMNKSKLSAAFSNSLTRSDIIFLTGAVQEVTMKTICDGLRIPVVHNIPKGSTIFKSLSGKDDGFAISAGSQCIIMLPDSSLEFIPMFLNYVMPYLCAFTNKHMVTRTARIFGISSTKVEEQIKDFTVLRSPVCTVFEKGSEVLVRISASAASKQEAAVVCSPILQSLVDRLGDYIYGIDVTDMAQVTIRGLLENGMKIATAESYTGGALGQMISSTPSSSDAYVLGVAVNTTRSKIQNLDIPEKILKKHGNVSELTAIHMANGAMIKGKSNIGIGITCSNDILEEKENSAVYIAVCNESKVWTKKLSLEKINSAEYREYIQNAAALHALNMTRLVTQGNVADGVDLPAALAGRTAPKSNLPWYKKAYEFIIPMKGDAAIDIIRKSILILAVVVFAGSITYLVNYQLASISNEKLTEEIADIYDNPEEYIVPPDYPEKWLPQFAGLYNMNKDVIGYLKIPGSDVFKYPVVQTPKDPEYYLRRDFTKANNDHGTPFLDGRSNITPEKRSSNFTIYGHNMQDGQMFGDLLKYQKLSYLKENPIIEFDTLYQKGEFKIISIFITNAYEEQGPVFGYHDFINAKTPEQFNEYTEQYKLRNLYKIDDDVKSSDNLLTLSTCFYNYNGAKLKEARFVIVGRRLRDGETNNIATGGYTTNPSPLLPESYQKVLKDFAIAATATTPATTTKATTTEKETIQQTLPETTTVTSTTIATSVTTPQTTLLTFPPLTTASSPPVTTTTATSTTTSMTTTTVPVTTAVTTTTATTTVTVPPATTTTTTIATAPPVTTSSAPPNSLSPPASMTTSSEVLVVNSPGGTVSKASNLLVAQIVQNEMGASFHEEALKAQAVAAYTFVKYQNNQNTTPSVSLKTNVDPKVQNAVDAVIGEAIYNGDSLAFTPYCAMSAGSTNNSKDVWGGDYTYLRSVPSQVDEQARNYQSSVSYPSADVARNMSKIGISLSGYAGSWFDTDSIERNEGGYITKIRVGGVETTGRKIRENAFSNGLRSAAFDVSYDPVNDRFIFTTYGYGHGVGMSQTGANLYAQSGWGYEDILIHYYKDTSIK